MDCDKVITGYINTDIPFEEIVSDTIKYNTLDNIVNQMIVYFVDKLRHTEFRHGFWLCSDKTRYNRCWEHRFSAYRKRRYYYDLENYEFVFLHLKMFFGLTSRIEYCQCEYGCWDIRIGITDLNFKHELMTKFNISDTKIITEELIKINDNVCKHGYQYLIEMCRKNDCLVYPEWLWTTQVLEDKFDKDSIIIHIEEDKYAIKYIKNEYIKIEDIKLENIEIEDIKTFRSKLYVDKKVDVYEWTILSSEPDFECEYCCDCCC
jgi:hypothetical protein